MKNTPQLKEIQKNMQPGVLVLTGFMGTDTRNLGDILLEDDAAVRRAGHNHQKIAQKMLYFRNEGQRGLGEFISLDGGYEVRTDSARGKLPCPFGDVGLFHKDVTVLTNTLLGITIVYSELSIHMIQEHGFYQGRGCPYRLDPNELIAIFGLDELDKE